MGESFTGTRAARPELYASWSPEFISCPPGFSHTIIERQNEPSPGTDVANLSPFGSGFGRQAHQSEPEFPVPTALSKVEVGVPDSGPLRPSPPPERSFARGLARGPAMRYTRFEKARILGARALQISMGSPILVDVPSGVVDPIEIAVIEFNSGAIPITVKRET